MAVAVCGRWRVVCRELGPVRIAQRTALLDEYVLRNALCCAHATRVAKAASSMMRKGTKQGWWFRC